MLQIARSTLSKGALGSLPIDITDVKFRGNYIKRVPATWDSIYGGTTGAFVMDHNTTTMISTSFSRFLVVLLKCKQEDQRTDGRRDIWKDGWT